MSCHCRSITAVPRSSQFVRGKAFVIASLVCVNFGFPSCVLVVAASVIVRFAFVKVV